MYVLHLITALESGGAEKVLFETIKHTLDDYNHNIIVLSKRGIYLKKMSTFGVSIERLSFTTLWKWSRYKNKCIIHSYLYHTHIASLLFKAFGFNVIWAIHSSQPPSSRSSMILKICSFLSYFIPDKIVYVSKVAYQQHIARGFTKSKNDLIYNGVDAHQSEISRGKDLTIDQRNTNIVMVSRYHPIKDYNRFFSIASEVLKVEPSIKFYLIGMDNTVENPDLVNDLRQYGLCGKISLLGEVENISHILHEFNLLVSTSKSESFALTVLEAILSGTNVSTIDLTVMNELFGNFSPNTGELKDSEIARKWIQKAKCPPSDELIEIAKNFSIEIMVSRYQDLYSQVAPSKNNVV